MKSNFVQRPEGHDQAGETWAAGEKSGTTGLPKAAVIKHSRFILSRFLKSLPGPPSMATFSVED